MIAHVHSVKVSTSEGSSCCLVPLLFGDTVSNTFFKRISRFCCSSMSNFVSKAKTPSKLSVSGPERLDLDSIMSKHDVEKFMEMK